MAPARPAGFTRPCEAFSPSTRSAYPGPASMATAASGRMSETLALEALPPPSAGPLHAGRSHGHGRGAPSIHGPRPSCGLSADGTPHGHRQDKTTHPHTGAGIFRGPRAEKSSVPGQKAVTGAGRSQPGGTSSPAGGVRRSGGRCLATDDSRRSTSTCDRSDEWPLYPHRRTPARTTFLWRPCRPVR